jgi:DNA-binding PadR family transcriptional regulator
VHPGAEIFSSRLFSEAELDYLEEQGYLSSREAAGSKLFSLTEDGKSGYKRCLTELKEKSKK